MGENLGDEGSGSWNDKAGGGEGVRNFKHARRMLLLLVSKVRSNAAWCSAYLRV